MGSFVDISDLAAAYRPRRRRSTSGLGQLGQTTGGPGVLSQYAIYPTSAAALAASKTYGAFYSQGGQIYMTGPYGPLQITNTSTVYPSASAVLAAGGYGKVFTQTNGTLGVSGPKGAISINMSLKPVAAPAPAPAPPPPVSTTVTPTPTPTPTTTPTTPAPSTTTTAVNAAVGALQAAQSAGTIKVYAAATTGPSCPSYMLTQQLPDGSSTCIDFVQARANAIIAAAQAALGSSNVAVLAAGSSCSAGFNPTTLPDGRILCFNPAVGTVSLLTGQSGTTGCPAGYAAQQVTVSPSNPLSGVAGATASAPGTLSTDVLCYMIAPLVAQTPAAPSVAPTITSVTTIGAVGTTVTILGTSFTGATSVTISGIPAQFVANSAGQITATVPAGVVAGTGTVVVTTPYGSASSASTATTGVGWSVIGSDNLGRPVYGLLSGYTVATAGPVPVGLVQIGVDANGNPVYGTAGGIYTPTSAATPAATSAASSPYTGGGGGGGGDGGPSSSPTTPTTPMVCAPGYINDPSDPTGQTCIPAPPVAYVPPAPAIPTWVVPALVALGIAGAVGFWWFSQKGAAQVSQPGQEVPQQ